MVKSIEVEFFYDTSAQADNNRGISGIMHNNSSLLVYDAEKASGKGMSDSQIIEGLTKTVESGAEVVNFSLGASGSTWGTTMGEEYIKQQGSKYSERKAQRHAFYKTFIHEDGRGRSLPAV